MKKLVLKTIFITFGMTLLLYTAILGLLSYYAPAAMMRFTASIGLETVSSDYAYRTYERTGDLEYLARAFEVAAEKRNDEKAAKRFDLLYASSGFAAFCEEQNLEADGGLPSLSYRAYVCGRASAVKYRLAETDGEKAAVITFALSETDASFPSDSPIVALALAAVDEEDTAFLQVLLTAIRAEEKFDISGEEYVRFTGLLERYING